MNTDSLDDVNLVVLTGTIGQVATINARGSFDLRFAEDGHIRSVGCVIYGCDQTQFLRLVTLARNETPVAVVGSIRREFTRVGGATVSRTKVVARTVSDDFAKSEWFGDALGVISGTEHQR